MNPRFYLAIPLFLALNTPMLSHHAALEFAAGTKMVLHGQVAVLEWANPHVHCFIEVKDSTSAQFIQWSVEMGSPAALSRLGIKKENLIPGRPLTIIGRQATDRSHRILADQIIFGKSDY